MITKSLVFIGIVTLVFVLSMAIRKFNLENMFVLEAILAGTLINIWLYFDMLEEKH